jgi:hypothetical protein
MVVWPMLIPGTISCAGGTGLSPGQVLALVYTDLYYPNGHVSVLLTVVSADLVLYFACMLKTVTASTGTIKYFEEFMVVTICLIYG